MTLALGLAGVLAAACGGGSDNGAAGHGGGRLDDGGEVRIERRYLPDGTSIQTVTNAYFIDAQDGNVNRAPLGECTDLRGDYESQITPAVSLRDSRSYLDVGHRVTLSSSGGNFDLARNYAGKDFRNHDTGVVYLKDEAAKGTVDPSMIATNAVYSITAAGDPDFDFSLYMPPDFTISGISYPADTFTTGSDIDLSITMAAQTNNPNETNNANFVVFFDPADGDGNGHGASHFCLFEGGSSSFTVPSSTVDELAATGFWLTGAVDHRLGVYNGRTLDLMGINCVFGSYTTN
jgi:hypothetical protein